VLFGVYILAEATGTSDMMCDRFRILLGGLAFAPGPHFAEHLDFGG